jgi:hypothetical protein
MWHEWATGKKDGSSPPAGGEERFTNPTLTYFTSKSALPISTF